MALVYADFETYPESSAAEVAAKVARLRLFLAELEALSDTGPDMSADGLSESWGSHETRMTRLKARLAELEKKYTSLRGSRMQFARISRR